MTTGDAGAVDGTGTAGADGAATVAGAAGGALPAVRAVRVAESPACELAESPRLSPSGRSLWFIDIEAARVWRVAATELGNRAAYESLQLPQLPGFVIPESDSSALLGLADGLYRLHWEGAQLARVWELPGAAVPVRINDGALAPDGAVWFGTMNLGEGDPDAGLLFRYAEGVARVVDGPVACWNGIVFDACDAAVLATDTLGREIRRYGRDGDRGASIAVPGPGRAGLPDGLWLAPDGSLWSAIWDAGEVLVLRGGAPASAVLTPGMRPTAIAGLPDGGVVITLAADAAGPGGLAVLEAAGVAEVLGLAHES
ncbi:SMP-30/gluconolactonase/LRE family protein [Leucobacter albus]|uniref:SMP-30/gluconolactonase/LRE family protein n=1 Tax=Leucobacter albus TaxID=272210 RepID=A0ABW3TPB0_9MICO